MTIRAATGVSEYPLPTRAVGEVVGQLLDAGFASADIVILAGSRSFQGAMADINDAVETLLEPGLFVSVVSDHIIGGSSLLRQDSALAALAITGIQGAPIRLEAGDDMADCLGAVYADQPEGFAEAGSRGFLIGDKLTVPMAVESLAVNPAMRTTPEFVGRGAWPGLSIDTPYLNINGRSYTDGAIGVAFGVSDHRCRDIDVAGMADGDSMPSCAAVFGLLDRGRPNLGSRDAEGDAAELSWRYPTVSGSTRFKDGRSAERRSGQACLGLSGSVAGGHDPTAAICVFGNDSAEIRCQDD